MSKKGENIYKRKDKRWEARYIKERTADGRVRYGYCYGKTYREAREKLLCAKAACREGKEEPAGALGTLDRYCREWLQLQRSRVKESTYVKYMTCVERHIRPRLGKTAVRELSPLAAEEFSYALLREQGLAPKTVKDILTVLHSILKYTAARCADPSLNLEIPYPKDGRREMRVLTPEEQQRMVTYLLTATDECKFGILLALTTGLRIGELCALRWKDISLAEGTLTVSSTMQRIKDTEGTARGKTRIVISDPKTDTSSRVIPLPDHIARLCRQRAPQDPAAFLLTGQARHYMEPRTLQYRLERYTRECGLTGVHFHTLRHTFATRCVEAGFEIKSLSEILGHASPRITLERYVHSSLELKRDNMNKLCMIG